MYKTRHSREAPSSSYGVVQGCLHQEAQLERNGTIAHRMALTDRLHRVQCLLHNRHDPCYLILRSDPNIPVITLRYLEVRYFFYQPDQQLAVMRAIQFTGEQILNPPIPACEKERARGLDIDHLSTYLRMCMINLTRLSAASSHRPRLSKSSLVLRG
ncbi:hypothetical protein BJY00DRAFT_293899 [Aspergillus carlsbadensis]|nr:hypothetical protein BJY00DRAFT_293899 [Aspergillus carlsbadensis]